jgi:hypothetical protein
LVIELVYITPIIRQLTSILDPTKYYLGCRYAELSFPHTD